MPTLVTSEIWRDGGSLSAVIRNEDGNVSSYWLQIAPWDLPREAVHSNLYVTAGAAPEMRQHRVEINSEEERALLALFQSADVQGCDSREKDLFAEIISILQQRVHSPAISSQST